MTEEEIEKYICKTMSFFVKNDPEYYSLKENYDWEVEYLRMTLYKKYNIGRCKHD